MSKLQLTRPLVIFDLETTGLDVEKDRIVEICCLRLDPDGGREVRTRRLDPERPIPPAATAIHGIRDEDVRGAPRFKQIARGLAEFIRDADLGGFNIVRFDIPLLEREFRDSGIELDLRSRSALDASTIFRRQERRDLTAAVRFFLDRDHTGAHTAEADVTATADVLEAQLERYPDLPREVDALDAWIRRVPADAVDRAGKFVRRDGRIVFGFGSHRGKPLDEVASEDPDYLEWILGSDFPPDAQQIVRDALQQKRG